jgi:hypothetical protein
MIENQFQFPVSTRELSPERSVFSQKSGDILQGTFVVGARDTLQQTRIEKAPFRTDFAKVLAHRPGAFRL